MSCCFLAAEDDEDLRAVWAVRPKGWGDPRGLGKADVVADAAKAADKASELSKVARSGKQERLREVAGDQKAASSDRGWIKQEQNSIDRGQRTRV